MNIDADDLRPLEDLLRAEARAREAASVDMQDLDQAERTAALGGLQEARSELEDALETWGESRSWLARVRRLPARLEALEGELELDEEEDEGEPEDGR